MKTISINDPIHARVSLTHVEQSVIDHHIFQRLRRIKALGLLEKVFPSARHSRFEHSIGVCHVAGEILLALRQNHSDISDLSKWKPSTQFKPWQYLLDFLRDQRIQQIKLAALLHDVGHGPFSHASEKFMPKREALINENDLPNYISEALKERTGAKTRAEESDPERADHEDYSLILAWRILTDIKKNHDFLNDDYVQDVLAFKFGFIQPSNCANEMIFKLFRTFVDGDFDSDRMDYLLRDSYFCGVPYGNFDLIRLLEGLYVLEDKSRNLTLGLKQSSLSAFEDFLFARFQMHSQVYSHRIDAAFNSALTTLVNESGFNLPGEIGKYSEIDDESFLTSPHVNLKSANDLRQLLLHRKKWSLVFETPNKEDPRPEKISKEIEAKIGKWNCAVGKSKRPFRNKEVLDLPIVMRDESKNFFTDKLKRIALILQSYDTTFFAKRVFVHPKKQDDPILKEILTNIFTESTDNEEGVTIPSTLQEQDEKIREKRVVLEDGTQINADSSSSLKSSNGKT